MNRRAFMSSVAGLAASSVAGPREPARVDPERVLVVFGGDRVLRGHLDDHVVIESRELIDDLDRHDGHVGGFDHAERGGLAPLGLVAVWEAGVLRYRDTSWLAR